MKTSLISATLALTMVATAAFAKSNTAELQRQVDAMQSVIATTETAMAGAKIQGGKAIVELPQKAFWGLAAGTLAYQASKGMLAETATGAKAAQLAKDIGFSNDAINHFAYGTNKVETVAQAGNYVSPQKLSFGVLGQTTDDVAQFAARNTLRIAGYSFIAISAVVAAVDTAIVAKDVVILSFDAAYLSILKADLTYARYELGKASGNLAAARQ